MNFFLAEIFWGWGWKVRYNISHKLLGFFWEKMSNFFTGKFWGLGPEKGLGCCIVCNWLNNGIFLGGMLWSIMKTYHKKTNIYQTNITISLLTVITLLAWVQQQRLYESNKRLWCKRINHKKKNAKHLVASSESNRASLILFIRFQCILHDLASCCSWFLHLPVFQNFFKLKLGTWFLEESKFCKRLFESPFLYFSFENLKSLNSR